MLYDVIVRRPWELQTVASASAGPTLLLEDFKLPKFAEMSKEMNPLPVPPPYVAELLVGRCRLTPG